MLLNKNLFFSGSLTKIHKPPSTVKPSTRSLFHSPSTKKEEFVLAVPLSPLKSKHNEKNPVQTVVKKKLKHFVAFRSSKLAEQLLPVTKALANGSIKKAVTLLLNSSDTTIKENTTKAIQYVIDRECYSFSDRDMNIQLQKTATRVNWKTLTYRKFNEILKPMHLYCGLVHLKLQHQNTAKHLILSKFVQLSVY